MFKLGNHFKLPGKLQEEYKESLGSFLLDIPLVIIVYHTLFVCVYFLNHLKVNCRCLFIPK